MTTAWRILVVDDEPTIAQQIAELLGSREVHGADEPVTAVPESSFERVLVALEAGKYDLLVLDVRDQGISEAMLSGGERDSGVRVFDEIRARRFIPIIFYTALPHEVELRENPPFVQVVSKLGAQPEAELRQAVATAIDSGFPRIHRALENHLEAITRDFVVDFIEKYWSEFDGYEADVAHLVSRRLGLSLERGADVLATRLGYPTDGDSTDRVHPTRYYIVPPDGDYRSGDLLCGSRLPSVCSDEDAAQCWYVILTPTCDLVRGRVKADQVVLAECRPLAEFQEWKTWINSGKNDSGAASGSSAERLEKLLLSRPYRQQADRYHYLPAAWQIPDLVVDNQRITSIPYARLEQYERVASLDSPYAEALAHRFIRFLGRLGTPDLNMDDVLNRMRDRAARSEH